jgi:hypothetical protein
MFPFLTFAGIIPASEDFSKSSRKCLMEANVGQEILTNGFVLELWSLVVLNTPGENKEAPPGKLSRREFSEILACILFKWGPDQVDKKFIKKVSYPRDIEVLKKKMESGVIGEFDIWQTGRKMRETYSVNKSASLNADIEMVENDYAKKSENENDELGESALHPAKAAGALPESSTFQDITPVEPASLLKDCSGASMEHQEMPDETMENPSDFCPTLSKMGFLRVDSTSVVNCLKAWTLSIEEVTNGFICEVLKHFGDSETIKVLISKIYEVLNIHPSRHNLFLRFYYYLNKTKSKSIKSEDPWTYLKDLSPGGKFYKSDLSTPVSKFQESVQNLYNSSKLRYQMLLCSACGSGGDHHGCQGYFIDPYCLLF